MYYIYYIIARLIIVASNCPALQKSVIEYYALLGKVNVHRFAGTNRELGTACGKLFSVSCLSVIDPGDSDITKGN